MLASEEPDMRRVTVVAALLLSTACATPQRTVPPAPGREIIGPAAVGTPKPGETLREYDLNHDGRTEVWAYSVKGADGEEVLVRKEKDLNGDGRIDSWEYYGPDGTLARLSYDMDFDGKPDVTLVFEKDQLVRKEYAFGFDGIPHSVNYYEKGKLVRKERHANADGKVDTWETGKAAPPPEPEGAPKR
jgi:hypothetical protein